MDNQGLLGEYEGQAQIVIRQMTDIQNVFLQKSTLKIDSGEGFRGKRGQKSNAVSPWSFENYILSSVLCEFCKQMVRKGCLESD